MIKIKKVVHKIREGFLKEVCQELKFIYQLSGAYKKGIILYTGLALFTACITLVISVQLKDFVDLLLKKDFKGVIAVAAIYISIGLVNLIIAMLSQRLSALISNRMRKDLSVLAYEKILTAEWENLTRLHSGDLMTRLSEDINMVSGSVVGWIPNLLSLVIQIGISALLIVYYDFSMIFLIMFLGPVVLFGSRIFLEKMYICNQTQRKAVSEVMTFLKESFHNIQSIKAFDLHRVFTEKSVDLQEKRRNIELQVNKYSIASWGVMYVSGQLGAMVCLAWTIYHIYTGAISVGTMTLLIVLANYIATAFKTLVQTIPNAVTTIASSSRIRSLLAMEDEKIEYEEESVEFLKKGMRTGVTIDIQHMDFSYQNGKKVFDNVTLKAEPGKIVALVGPSGEGKTTMLRILLGLVRVPEGRAVMRVGNSQEDTLPLNPSLRKLIAYVPQGNTIMSGTIAENLRLVREDASDEELMEALDNACALDFVSKLPAGIHQPVGEGGIGFSEGQAQRLAIARALLCRTPILFLDEATSALDVVTERKILKNLMGQAARRTCILTTHRPSVLAMCSSVYRIVDHKVTELNDSEIKNMINDF